MRNEYLRKKVTNVWAWIAKQLGYTHMEVYSLESGYVLAVVFRVKQSAKHKNVQKTSIQL